MRWLFLFVLFLNLAYIGWQMSLSPADSYAGIAPLKGAQPIVLLSEVKSHAMEQEATDIVVEERASEEAVAEQQDDTQAPEEPATIIPEIRKQQSVSADAEQKPDLAAVDNKPVKVSEKIAPINAVKPDVVQKKPVSTGLTGRCFTLGPFRDLAKLRGLTREIKPYVATTDFRGQEKAEPVIYWVYIEPEKNYKKATETGNRLKAQKIKDFYVIREGEKINGLSLGHFRNKKGAYRLAKKVKKRGFDVQVKPVLKNHTFYWLDYRLASGEDIPATIFDKYIKAARKDKIERLIRDCAAR